jgi:phage baseplate assembly protein W
MRDRTVDCRRDARFFQRRARDCSTWHFGLRADGNTVDDSDDPNARDRYITPANLRGACHSERSEEAHSRSFAGKLIVAMNLDYPIHFDGRGRTAATDDDDHIRDLIEQVLFTMPGERVNRPTFGSGLLQLVFAPNSDALAAATQLSVQASLQQWLGDLIQVQSVNVESRDSRLEITVQYTIRRTQQSQVAQFTRTI